MPWFSGRAIIKTCHDKCQIRSRSPLEDWSSGACEGWSVRWRFDLSKGVWKLVDGKSGEKMVENTNNKKKKQPANCVKWRVCLCLLALRSEIQDKQDRTVEIKIDCDEYEIMMAAESLLWAGTWVGMLGLSNLKPFLTANASNNWEMRKQNVETLSSALPRTHTSASSCHKWKAWKVILGPMSRRKSLCLVKTEQNRRLMENKKHCRIENTTMSLESLLKHRNTYNVSMYCISFGTAVSLHIYGLTSFLKTLWFN